MPYVYDFCTTIKTMISYLPVSFLMCVSRGFMVGKRFPGDSHVLSCENLYSIELILPLFIYLIVLFYYLMILFPHLVADCYDTSIPITMYLMFKLIFFIEVLLSLIDLCAGILFVLHMIWTHLQIKSAFVFPSSLLRVKYLLVLSWTLKLQGSVQLKDVSC